MTDLTETAADRSEQALARAFLFFRVGGIVEIVFAGYVDVGHYPSPLLVGVLVLAVVLESAIVCGAALRRGRVRPAASAFDTVFSTAGLIVGALLTRSADGHTWAYFMYPYSIIIAFGIGIGFRRVSTVVAFTTLMVAGYLVSSIGIHHDPAGNDVANALTYYPNTIVAWAIARRLRRSADETDEQRETAVRQAAELARERERTRHARMLHDRVLQTLEALAQGTWIADTELRSEVAGEAAWLRALVEGAESDERGTVVGGLQELVERFARRGLRVELNCAGAVGSAIPPPLVTAIVGATHEALSNVIKHSGVDDAIVHLATDGDRISVSVLDHGRGFDPELPHGGVGLRESICARITDVGGDVRVDSAPGAGTHLEISVPLIRGSEDPMRDADPVRGVFGGQDFADVTS